jgi:spore maturation protein A
MMNKVFAFMIIIGSVIGIVTGHGADVSQAAFDGAKSAIDLCLSIGGAICLWSGLMKLIEKSGMLTKISTVFSPVTKILFPDIQQNSGAMNSIIMNIAANFLGLANAATPLGLKAMTQLAELNNNNKTASRSMIMLVVINSASFQLLPSSLIALRLAAGSKNPFEVIVPVWLASFCCVMTGIIMTKVLSLFNKER